MNPTERPGNDPPQDRGTCRYRRRRLLALGTTVAATALAGCSGERLSGGGDGGGTPAGGSNGAGASSGTGTPVGRFRLLVSDRPADIGDFDSLEVSFERARIVRADDGSTAESESPTASPSEAVSTAASTATVEPTSTTDSTNATGTPPATPANTAAETSTEGERAGEAEGDGERERGEEPESRDGAEADGGRGFLTLDLEGATVDLTRVVGEKAIGIGEEEVPEGRYAKIELYAAEVVGIVDGDRVEVKIPSGKLQIVEPFEVEAGETVSFVFDINVVRKGRSERYNLLPVIAESGVAGEDVDVNEVATGGGRDATRTDEGERGGTTHDRGGDGGGHDPSEAGPNGTPDGGEGSQG